MTDNTGNTPIAIVGVTATAERLRTFDGPTALRDAEEYVDTLPDREQGIYYIDYPCDAAVLAFNQRFERVGSPEAVAERAAERRDYEARYEAMMARKREDAADA